jgi:actin-related protein 3
LLGDETLANFAKAPGHGFHYPICHGMIADNWPDHPWNAQAQATGSKRYSSSIYGLNEKIITSFWYDIISHRGALPKILIIICLIDSDSTDSELPLYPPEDREQTAEIFLESFNIKGLYIAVQAVLALAAFWTSNRATDRTLTCTVIDSGYGVTHVIPCAEGYIIGSAIKHIPIAVRDISEF